MKNYSPRVQRWLEITLVVVVAYYGISLFAYAMAHPRLTQVQVFSKTFEAMTWQW